MDNIEITKIDSLDLLEVYEKIDCFIKYLEKELREIDELRDK